MEVTQVEDAAPLALVLETRRISVMRESMPLAKTRSSSSESLNAKAKTPLRCERKVYRDNGWIRHRKQSKLKQTHFVHSKKTTNQSSNQSIEQSNQSIDHISTKELTVNGVPVAVSQKIVLPPESPDTMVLFLKRKHYHEQLCSKYNRKKEQKYAHFNNTTLAIFTSCLPANGGRISNLSSCFFISHNQMRPRPDETRCGFVGCHESERTRPEN